MERSLFIRPLALVRRGWRSAFLTSAWTTVGFSLLAGIGGIIATRALGPYERGLLATAVVWSSVAASLSAYGTPGAATYFTARDGQYPRRAAATVMAVGAAIGAAVALAGLLVALLLLNGPVASPMAIAFATMLPGISAGAALGAILGMGDYRRWGLARMLAPGLTLVGVIVATAAGWRTAVAITTVTAAATAIQLFVLVRLLAHRGLAQRPHRALVRPVLAYTWRNVAGGVGLLIANRLDQLVLSVIVVPQLLGYYAVAVSLGAIIQPVAQSAGSVVLRRGAAGGPRAVRASLPVGLGVAGAIAGASCTLVFIFAQELVTLLFGSAFAPAIAPLRVLLIGTVALAASAVLSDALRALGKPLLPARAGMTGALATLVLLPVLLPLLGLLGAAIASTTSSVLMALVGAWNVRTALRRSTSDATEVGATS